MRVSGEPHNHVTQAADVVDIANNMGDGCRACSLIRPATQDERSTHVLNIVDFDLEAFFGPLPQPVNRD